MTMLREPREPNAEEARENLRIIRSLMERSTKYSTFSGFSGITAGLVSIIGCLVTHNLAQRFPDPIDFRLPFLTTWTLVILVAVLADYLLTKRRAAQVGKRILSRLGKQMILASLPGLGTGTLLTLFLMQYRLLDHVYPIWMLSYGIAVCAVGLFSQREVSLLGAAFLLIGAITLFLPISYGLTMMAVAFGGFHIVYGVVMSRKDGW